jgi:hypothetical protein
LPLGTAGLAADRDRRVGAIATPHHRETHHRRRGFAGYIAAWENRSLILFKHKDHKYLVQCSVLVDVLRAQRLVTVCYELE